ncbi:DUF7373 family lipoprotein [Antrihabitans stalactiti]|uniref:Uncharacterized protein n=1 Tax=Antrihabitans stalactiti TaxID=2584121 RepID=A0A848KIS1_9NOCA|nr:hypothetical protein [Antrihabitans stalactiti]NMN98973.1 hypothetical protein [Antrihabitans stalactiti]
MRSFVISLIVATMVATVGASLTGCSGSTAGHAKSQEVDLASLDVGNYETTPPDGGLGNSGSDEVGRLLDAQRLANFVVDPVEVDDALRRGVSPTYVIRNAPSLAIDGGVFTAKAATPAVKYSMRYGFAASRATERNDRVMTIAVFVFSTSDDAKGAADEFAAAEQASDTSAKPVPLSTYPDARAVASDARIAVYYPKDRLLYYQSYKGSDLVKTAELTLAEQLPLLAEFTPTDWSKTEAIPRDREGMLARTLRADEPSSNEDAVLDLAGIEHFLIHPKEIKAALERAGVDLAAVSETRVYRAKDAAAAQKFQHELADAYPTELREIDPPPGLATAQCFENTDDTLNDRFACFGSRGRYAFSLGSGQRNDAYQQAAAQYALLVNSE